MSPKISLIVATVGRCGEFGALLASLASQTLPWAEFEVIVVDQNDILDLGPVLSRYADRLSIRHVRSLKGGLSVNRNIGLNLARGEILAFPDDDCRYYPDTLENVLASFDRYPTASLVLGTIYDRAMGKQLLRTWPTESLRVTKWNFYRLLSSVTIFSKVSELRFDECLGVGTKFGSNEDADYVYRVLGADRMIRYEPAVHVWHPANPASESSMSRVSKYGAGFGAFVVKNLSLSCAILFVESLAYHLAIAARAFCLLDFGTGKAHAVALISRLVGALEFGLGRVARASDARATS
jgi:glycosyltransferase involved in cell wall biosynthesis